MRRLVIPLLITLIASPSWAADVWRDIETLAPIKAAVARVKPDFSTGIVNSAWTGEEVIEHLRASGYKMLANEVGFFQVESSGKSLGITPFTSVVRFGKTLDDYKTTEVFEIYLLPGNGGIWKLGREVEFHYRLGQAKLKTADVEKAFSEKFGNPTGTLSIDGSDYTKRIEHTYCYSAAGDQIADPQKCNINAQLDDGFTYVIAADDQSSVERIEVHYISKSYYFAFKEAVEAKLKYLLDSDQIWEFRKPKILP